MRSICLYFQVHQPFRLRTYRFFDIGKDHYYYDDYLNRSITQRVAKRSYLPANQVIMDLINEYGSAFKVTYSITGIALEQFEKYAPEVIDSFRKLAGTGSVEFLTETYAHSLASLRSKDEFVDQVKKHSRKIEQLFGVKPTVFRNTELIYSDRIGEMVADMGYELMLTEGARHILGWKSPNYMYVNAINPRLKLLLKNFRLSDDIAFRFSLQSWNEWPLTTDKFVSWIQEFDPREEVVNLFMDYETFGEHQWADSGIFEFLRSLPGQVLSSSNYVFRTPSELAGIMQPVSAIHVPFPISWADEERDITAWLGNEMQNEAVDKLFSLEEKIKGITDDSIRRDWYYLQSSDHFYYMCTKWFSDGDVHKYFNPYSTPYEAFINYMNVLSDFILRVENGQKKSGTVNGGIPAEPKTAAPELKKTTRKKKKEYAFSDLGSLTASQFRILFRELDMETLVCALLDANQPLIDKVLANLGKKKQVEFEALTRSLNKTRKTEINHCRTKIAGLMSELF
jgi:alpha-amylase